jgi:hypothetical protein
LQCLRLVNFILLNQSFRFVALPSDALLSVYRS